MNHISNKEQLKEFVRFFTDRFYGQAFSNERQLDNCIEDFQNIKERESHNDMWPEVKSDEQSESDSQRHDT